MTKNVLALIFSLFFHHCLSLVSSLPLVPALYVFGDSLFDSGNNNFLPTLAKANFLPYGMNFVGGATGRFTNGRTVADFIAEYLGLPYPPSYMSIRRSTPLTGLNYASASCGILPRTGSTLGKCLSLDDQIDLFHITITSGLAKHFKYKEELSAYLSKSIFIVSIGSNDYLNNYLDSEFFDTSKRFSPPAFAQYLLDELARRFERLYNLGARKVLMFETGPIGCTPSITRKQKLNQTCVESSNKLVSHFNKRLPQILRNLTSSLQGSIFSHGHANWLGYDAIMNPSNYGLMDTGNPCCTTWGNGTSVCIPWLLPCTNPNEHYFFDAYHLTEGVYSIISSRCINDTSVCSPVVKELINM